MLANVIVVVVIALILGGAISYILRAKKRGVKCIGCDSSKSCGCSSDTDNTSKDKDSANK